MDGKRFGSSPDTTISLLAVASVIKNHTTFETDGPLSVEPTSIGHTHTRRHTQTYTHTRVFELSVKEHCTSVAMLCSRVEFGSEFDHFYEVVFFRIGKVGTVVKLSLATIDGYAKYWRFFRFTHRHNIPRDGPLTSVYAHPTPFMEGGYPKEKRPPHFVASRAAPPPIRRRSGGASFFTTSEVTRWGNFSLPQGDLISLKRTSSKKCTDNAKIQTRSWKM